MTDREADAGLVERKFNDPVEIIVAEALDFAGVSYIHESSNKSQRFDFAVTGGPFIECKQFSTPRTAKQIEGIPNVIVVQGLEAARWLASVLTKAVPLVSTPRNSGEQEHSVTTVSGGQTPPASQPRQ